MATKVYNGLDLQNTKITNLTSPSADTDAANKAYVDAAAAGLSWKTAVRAATTANVNLTTDVDAGSSLDGVTLAEGDRILIKDNTDSSENGIYLVPAASGTATRSNDCDSTDEVNGATVLVLEGSTNADTAWTQSADDPTIDEDDLLWAQFGGGASYTFGDGLVNTAGDIDIELGTNSGLSLAGGTLQVNSSIAGDGLDYASGVLSLDLASGGGLEFGTGELRIAGAAAGNGLTGGGGSALAVGAGTGITVNSNDVEVTTPLLFYSASVGGSTSINVDHNLATTDVIVQTFLVSTGETVLCDVTRSTTNRVVLAFASAPSASSIRVLVMAAG